MQKIVTTATYSSVKEEITETQPIYLEETYVNTTKGWIFGESGMYKSFCDTSEVRRLFRSLQKEYGRCMSRVYVDNASVGAIAHGWVFEKRMQYEDSKKEYTREVWVSCYVKNEDDSYSMLELKG